MQTLPTSLEGVLLVKPEIHEDFRGANVSIYIEEEYQAKGIPIKFVEDKVSVSSRKVLRGIHGDPGTWKLVTCLSGKIFFVVVNFDETSKEFGKWESFELSGENHLQVLVPPIYGNAHLVVSDRAVFHYKWSDYYHPERQIHHPWNDPRFNIPWPIKDPILSQRDAG